MDRRLIQLLRAFLPSWKFFAESGPTPTLYVRWSENANDLGPWQELLPKMERKWWHLVFNPSGNLLHAERSLVQQLTMELNEKDDIHDFESSPAFLLIQRLILAQLKTKTPIRSYQFKVVAQFPKAQTDQSFDVLISAVVSR